MKRMMMVLLALGLIVGSIAGPAEAGKKKKKKKPAPPAPIVRTVEFEYECPCGARVLGTGLAWQFGESTGENIGGGPVPLQAEDLWVTAKAEDQSGQKVRVGLAHDTDGDGLNNTWGVFCGETTEPIEVSQAEAVMRVFVTSGTCDDGTPALALGGKITFTFSNVPLAEPPPAR